VKIATFLYPPESLLDSHLLENKDFHPCSSPSQGTGLAQVTCSAHLHRMYEIKELLTQYYFLLENGRINMN
jgi:hypothetical protein